MIRKGRFFILFRFLAEFTARASSIITFPLLARCLGAEGYGIQAQIWTITGFLVPVATLGLGFSVVRMVAGNAGIHFVSTRFYSSLMMVVVVSSVLAGGVLFAAPVLNALVVKVDWAIPILRWSALMVVLTALELTLNDYYRARLRIVEYSLFQMFQTLINVLGLVLVLLWGGRLLEVVLLSIAVKAIFVLLVLGYFLTTREVEWPIRLMPWSELSKMVRFGIPIVIMGVSAWMMSLGDRAVIGYYLSAEKVGVYNAAYSLALILVALATPFWGPLYPVMALHKNKGDIAGLTAVCRKYTSGYLLIGIPALVGLTVLASPLLQALGSAEFAIHPITFGMISLGLFSDQFAVNAHYLVYLHDEPGFMRNIMILGGCVNLALNIVAIPFLGITGAAMATLLSYALIDVLLFRRIASYGYRLVDLYSFRLIGQYVLSAAIMGGVVYAVCRHVQQGITQLGALVFIGVICYGVVLLALNGFRPRQVLEISS